MPTSPMSEVLEHLRRTALLREGASLTDGQLLEAFLSRRDEAALAALVRRHGPMVWGVCRRLLSNYHDAEDAFQATFLVLVRKAASIWPREMVANWLYGVAHQTALKARAMAARRKGRERQVMEMPEPAVVEQQLRRDLQPLLDEELSRLPDKYRVVIVLCDLEGKTRKEAARQLGCPEGTVAGRLARARAMLAKRLARHGLVVSGGVLAAVLAQNVASAGVPASVVSSTIKAGSLVAAGQTVTKGVISARVAALTEGVLRTMLLTKLRIATMVVLIVVAFISAGSAGLIYRTQAAEPVTAQSPDPPKKDPVKNDMESIQGTWRLVKLEANGVEIVLPPFGEKSRAVFAGNKWTMNFMKGKGERGGFSFKLDPKKQPKAIDLQPLEDRKETLLGIYRLEGDDLTICYAMAGKQERPSAFENYWTAGTYTMLIVLKREDPTSETATTKPMDEQRKGEQQATEPKAIDQSPVREKNEGVRLPNTYQPDFIIAWLDENERIAIMKHVIQYELVETTINRNGKKHPVAYYQPVLKYEVKVFLLEEVRVFGTDGKEVERKALSELLKEKTPALLSLDGKKIDPFYLRFFKEGMPVIVIPGSNQLEFSAPTGQ